MSRIKSLADMYRKPKYLILTAIIALFYYLLLNFILISSQGIVMIKVPFYLLYPLIATSAVLLTLSIKFIAEEARAFKKSATSSMFSVITAIFGSVVASCNCSAPILASFLYVAGLNALAVSSILVFVSTNQNIIFTALILINLISIYHYSGKLKK